MPQPLCGMEGVPPRGGRGGRTPPNASGQGGQGKGGKGKGKGGGQRNFSNPPRSRGGSQEASSSIQAGVGVVSAPSSSQ